MYFLTCRFHVDALLRNSDGEIKHHAQPRQRRLSPLCISALLLLLLRGRVSSLRGMWKNGLPLVYLCEGVNKVNPHTVWPFMCPKTTDWTIAAHRKKFNCWKLLEPCEVTERRLVAEIIFLNSPVHRRRGSIIGSGTPRE